MAKRIGFNVEDKIQEMVERIQAEYGYSTQTQIWTQAMIEFYGSKFKDYLQKTPKQQRTPEEEAEHQMKMEEAKKNVKKNAKLKIAEKLGAKLVDNGNENISAQWYTYWNGGKDLQEMPLMSLTEDLISNQFQGNLEKIKAYHNLK